MFPYLKVIKQCWVQAGNQGDKWSVLLYWIIYTTVICITALCNNIKLKGSFAFKNKSWFLTVKLLFGSIIFSPSFDA